MKDQTDIKNRLKNIDDDYQLIIIGGGIYGAALCWEASHRGVKTLLVEKDDYACGASSNSLKTIHGGLRSLQSLNFPAVIKGIRERSIFLTIAKNYVKPLPCILPTTRTLKRSRLFIGMGLFIYNSLNLIINGFTGFNKQLPHGKLLSIYEFKKRLHGIISDQITGGGLWFDAQVENTERMVLQFIKSANKYRAVTLNHTAAIKLTDQKISGKHRLLIADQINGDEKYVNSLAIIDCTSAWNFISQSFAKNRHNETITFLKSVNIIINKKLFETAFGLNIKQKNTNETRLYFFAPWRDCTMIGTWYSFSKNYPEQNFSEQEARQCIDDVNSALSNQKISLDDICNVHIGYLPAQLAHSVDSSNIDKYLLTSYQLTDWSDKLGAQHVYSLRGTKYTLARHDAQQVIDQLSNIEGWDVSSSKSDQTPIYREAQELDYTFKLADEIVHRLKINYGADIQHVLKFIEKIPEASKIIPGTTYHILAEIYYAVYNEQALTLSDLLKRRLDIGDRAPPNLETSNYCATIMQQLLSWSDETLQKQINQLYASYPDFMQLNDALPAETLSS